MEPVLIVFPTHVGVFPAAAVTPPGATCLPHARGGVSTDLRQLGETMTSSPRTWGCFYTQEKQNLRLIRLPHARGGVSGRRDLEIEQHESSPRTWGCFLAQHRPDPLPRVFPTHVGVFPPAFSKGMAAMCLPHARGGVSDGAGLRLPGQGASPRTWGCFHTSLRRGRTQYVFPTHVGVFLRRLIAVMISGSLPHARGGVSGIHDAPYQRGHSFCLHHVRGVFLVRGLPALAYWSLPYTCGT
ncbi:Domain of uncharacterised function (DUF2825) [Klebsiella pneumoniae]|nr:Domain of uncharacterised function (DUF2825) [Klebsiella pneumoniae]